MTSKSVETRIQASLWYAWGQVDAGILPGFTLEDGWAFSREQEAVAQAYYGDDGTMASGSLDSLMGAWAEYVARRQAELVKA